MLVLPDLGFLNIDKFAISSSFTLQKRASCKAIVRVLSAEKAPSGNCTSFEVTDHHEVNVECLTFSLLQPADAIFALQATLAMMTLCRDGMPGRGDKKMMHQGEETLHG